MRSHARFAAALPLAAFALLAPHAAAAQPDVVSITRRAGPAVVTLHAYNAAGQRASLGSGFFLPDGRIATNRHVVEGAARISVTSADDRQLGSAEYAEAVGSNADLAILPRIGTTPATIPVATRMPEPGEAVVVIGAPEGLSNTVSTGIVSAIRRIRGRTLVQITAPISHGSSGGPVMNMRGEVIGVSVSVLSEGQNLNFAVPASELTTLQQARPQRIAFTGNLRNNVGGGDRPSGPDINTLPLPRLPRIAVGQTVTGRLTNTDFVRPDGSYADTYVYSARAGERVTVTLRSRDFDSWVVVSDRSGGMNEFDDDGGGGLDSELTVTFPRDGQYLIVANSVTADATGGYQMSLRSAGRGEIDPGGGGRGTIADLARRTTARITSGQTVNGRLSSGDFIRSDDNTYADGYLYAGRRGERLTITMRSTAFDSYLVFDEPTGPLRETDDDSGGGNDARVTVTLPRDGNYLIMANAYARGGAGAYTLSVTSSRGGGPVDDGGGRPQPGGRGSLSDLARMNIPRITVGQSVSGRLSTGDFVRTDDNTFADGYAFEGRRGERITITMRASSFDAWVVFDDPNGPTREHDDDSAGGTDARLTVTLPRDGRFLIVANAVSAGSTGAYTLSVERGGGGGGDVPRPEDDDDHDHGDDNGNAGGGGSVADLLSSGRAQRITSGQTINGSLSSSDFLRDDDTYADGYIYNGRAGERLTITMRASSFDAWVVIDDPDSEFREHDDDGAGGTDARLTVTLPRSGRYVILANSVARSTGSYTLSVTSSR
jgi:hypothetical protein